MPKLLLGPGEWNWPDWVSVDASPDSPSTYHAIIPPLPSEVMAQTWDVIMAIHFIEHLAPWKAKTLLSQCYAILKPGGSLILEQPNIKECARFLLEMKEPPAEAEDGQYDMWGFYGDPNHHDELMLHRWGYHPDSLEQLLVECGFGTVKRMTAEYHRPGRDFRMVAVK